jgi:hypothetical protein
MDKYNSGTSVLYLVLYRLSYGFRKNKIKIDDDTLAKRSGIPKRTLAKYRIELEECDLIQYERGYKTTRKPEYTILLPHQSQAFRNILHKTANILPKNVKSLVSNTKYKLIDKHTKHIETLVREFYSKIGKTEYHLTRKQLADGIKTIQALLIENYTLEDVKGCIKYTIETKPDVYSVSFLNYSIGDYLVEKEKSRKRAETKKVEIKKEKIRNKQIALEKHLIDLYNDLPQSQQNTMMYEAESKAHKYMTENNIKYGEKFIVDNYLQELLEIKFSDVVRNW